MTNWQRQAVLALLAILTGSGALGYYNAVQRRIGRQEAEIAQLVAERRQALMRADSLEKAYKVDTVKFWRTVRTVDTLTQSVDVWKHDTLKVVEYVEKADTAIKACTLALQTCEQRVGAERQVNATLKAENAVLRKQLPSRYDPLRHRIEGAVVGLAVGALLKP